MILKILLAVLAVIGYLVHIFLIAFDIEDAILSFKKQRYLKFGVDMALILFLTLSLIKIIF